jgi:hypothetical protein
VASHAWQNKSVMREDETIIEVVTFDSRHERVSTAEALTPEDAVYAGQVMHDEAFDHRGRYSKFSTAFFVDGKLVRMVDGRP